MGHSSLSQLLARGAKVDIQNTKGQTALYVAVKNGHYDIVKLLLKAQCDVNLREYEHGESPLHIAVLVRKHSQIWLIKFRKDGKQYAVSCCPLEKLIQICWIIIGIPLYIMPACTAMKQLSSCYWSIGTKVCCH